MGAAPLNKGLGVDFTLVTSIQKHELGAELDGNDGRRYKYGRATAAIAVADCLVADPGTGAYHVKQSTAAADLVIAGCAHVAVTTAGDYFWYVIQGLVSMKAAATVVVGAPIVTIATAGTVDDTAATAANALAAGSGKGGIFASTTTGGLASVLLMG